MAPKPEVVVTSATVDGGVVHIAGTISTITEPVVVERGEPLTEDVPVTDRQGQPVVRHGKPLVRTVHVIGDDGPERAPDTVEERPVPLLAAGDAAALEGKTKAEQLEWCKQVLHDAHLGREAAPEPVDLGIAG